MNIPVFVYGTLKYGEGNHRFLEGGYERYEEAMLRDPAELFCNGGFPYAVFHDMRPDIVGPHKRSVGELYFLKKDMYEDIMRSLDSLEGVAYRHYIRQERPVEMSDGSIFNAYVYTPPVDSSINFLMLNRTPMKKLATSNGTLEVHSWG